MPYMMKFYWVIISSIEVCLTGVFVFIITGMNTIGSIIFGASLIISIYLSMSLNKTKKEDLSEDDSKFDVKSNSDKIYFEMKVGKNIAVSIISIVFGTTITSYFGKEFPYIALPVLLISFIVPIIIGLFLNKSAKSVFGK